MPADEYTAALREVEIGTTYLGFGWQRPELLLFAHRPVLSLTEHRAVCFKSVDARLRQAAS